MEPSGASSQSKRQQHDCPASPSRHCVTHSREEAPLTPVNSFHGAKWSIWACAVPALFDSLLWTSDGMTQLVWWRAEGSAMMRGSDWMTQSSHFLSSELHTSVSEKPCLRNTQAGPTMCSMLQFFTSEPKASLYGFSSTSWSSSPSKFRPCWPAALILAFRGPSTTPFRGKPDCYSTISSNLSEHDQIFQGAQTNLSCSHMNGSSYKPVSMQTTINKEPNCFSSLFVLILSPLLI